MYTDAVRVPQRWKWRVKAPDLAFSLYDHIKLRARVDTTNPSESKPNGLPEAANHEGTTTAYKLPEIPAGDRWVLKHITLAKLHPVMEALDADGSSLVTVHEVNEFTSGRPKEWRWLSGATVSLRR